MEDLIKKVTAAAGISEEQAKKSIETISGYIKDRLPDSFKSQIDNLVNGGTLTAGMKTKMSAVADELRDKAEDVIDDMREKLSDIFSSKKEEGK
ncbi:MAG: hypothetical protein ABIO46_06330 [Chitinophagales bacterium]